MNTDYEGKPSACATLVALTIAASASGAGCTAAGYRPSMYDESHITENEGVKSERARVVAVAYGLGTSSIDVLAQRTCAMVDPAKRAQMFEQEHAPKILESVFSSSVFSQNPYEVARWDDRKLLSQQEKQKRIGEQRLLDDFVKHNDLVGKLLANGMLDRWLLAHAEQVTGYDFGAKLDEEEYGRITNTVSKVGGSLVGFDERNGLKILAGKHAGLNRDLQLNEAALKYVRQVVVAYADVHMLELNVVEASACYEIARQISVSLSPVDDDKLSADKNRNVVRALRLPLRSLPDFVPLRKRYEQLGVDKVNERMPAGKEITSLDQLNVNDAVNLALAEFTDEFKRNTYSDRHSALQGDGQPGSVLLSVPYVLPNLDPRERIVVSRWIVGEMAEISREHENGTAFEGSDFALMALPFFGPVYAGVTGGVRDAFTANTYVPTIADELVSDGKWRALAQVLNEGNRIASGDGTANHFVGDNLTAQVGWPTGIATTAIVAGATAAVLGAGSSGGSAVPSAGPAIGGGGAAPAPPF